MDFDEFCDTFGINNLNPQQETAVKRVDGATLLVSVPGSGKTTVIVARTGYMIKCAGVNPRNILTLTFTTAAAKEMKARFLKKFELPEAEAPTFSTIHSYCYKIVRYCQQYKGEQLPKLETNSQRIVREICAAVLPEYPSDAIISAVAQKITEVKNLMMSDDQVRSVELDTGGVDFSVIYHAYQGYLHDNRLMDFDDMLIFAHDFLTKYPDVLQNCQDRYKYISVDEAQDTSLVQHRVVELLAKKYGNIFMVGDDDQSIYGFRGAYPQALLDFKDKYEDAVILSMEINYRSDKAIIEMANAFIKRNNNRHDKAMIPFSDQQGVVNFTEIKDYRIQHEILLAKIKRYVGGEETLAILYRNNESAIPLLCLLDEEGIAVDCRDDGNAFFSHFLVQDFSNYLKLAGDMKNLDLFSRIYYKLNLFLNKSVLEAVSESMALNNDLDVFEAMLTIPSLYDKYGEIKRIGKVFRSLRSTPPDKALLQIMHRLGYQKVIEEKASNGSSAASMYHKFNTLRAIASQQKTVDAFLTKLDSVRDRKRDPSSNITLSTMHSSKGLEFDKVIIIDVLDGVLPTNAKGESPDPEEDARLFYVAMTRAKRELEFLVAKCAFGDFLTKSEFIEEIQNPRKPKTSKKVSIFQSSKQSKESIATATDYKEGDHVSHKVFGKGKVMKVTETAQNAHIIEVNFISKGTKKLLLEAAINNDLIKKR